MGYYTFFELKVYSFECNEEELDKDKFILLDDTLIDVHKYGITRLVEEEENKDDPDYKFDENSNWTLFDETQKWYDCLYNMTEYSKRFPNLVFEIFGEGEEHDDNWVAYFLNGKYSYKRAEIIYEDFKLKALEEYKNA